MLPRIIECGKEEIVVHQNLSLSHAGSVWDGSLILIAYLNKQAHLSDQLFKNRTVLELGSGTGSTGLSLIHFRPKKLILTDMPEFLEILEVNKNANKALSEKFDCETHVEPLLWGNEEHESKIFKLYG